jgi:hypothetical protein
MILNEFNQMLRCAQYDVRESVFAKPMIINIFAVYKELLIGLSFFC